MPVAAAALVRGAFALALLLGPAGTRAAYEVDSWSYRNAAVLLRSGGWLSPDWLLLFRTPGYPLLLMPGLAIGAVEWVTVCIQIALGAATVWLVGDSARLASGSARAGLLAEWAYALEPLAIVFPSLLLTETLYAALLALALRVLAGCGARFTVRRSAAVGVLLGAAALVRPAGLYLPAVLAMVLLAGSIRRLGLRRAAVPPLALVACGAALPGVWIARNAAVSGWPGLSSVSVVNAYFFDAAAVRAEAEHVSFHEMRRRMGSGHPQRFLAVHPEQRGWSQQRILGWQAAEARRVLLRHPWQALRIYAGGIVRTAVEPGTNRLLQGAGPVGRCGPVRAMFGLGLTAWLLLLAVLAVCGARSGRWIGPMAALLAAVALYHLALGGGPGAESWFRHPAMPAVCILAGVGAAQRKAPGHGCISETGPV